MNEDFKKELFLPAVSSRLNFSYRLSVSQGRSMGHAAPNLDRNSTLRSVFRGVVKLNICIAYIANIIVSQALLF